MKKLITGLLFSVAFLLQGCNDETKPEHQYLSPPVQAGQASVPPANQPQVVYQQAPVQQAEDHTIRDGLIGAGVGYMLGRNSGGGVHQSVPSTTVVNRTVVNKTVVIQRPPTPSYNRYKPSPSTSKSYSSRRR